MGRGSGRVGFWRALGLAGLSLSQCHPQQAIKLPCPCPSLSPPQARHPPRLLRIFLYLHCSHWERLGTVGVITCGNTWEHLGTPGNTWERLGTVGVITSGNTQPGCERCSHKRSRLPFPSVPRCSQVFPGVPRCSQVFPQVITPTVPNRSQVFPGVPRCSRGRGKGRDRGNSRTLSVHGCSLSVRIPKGVFP